MNTEFLPELPLKTDVAIIGAGAAGLMAGIAAARAGARVHLFDGAKKVGAKILVSGGSRCNVTNEDVVPGRYHGEGAAPFVSRILRSFSPADTHRFFQSIGVELKLEATGKFFPVTDTSRTVLNALLQTAAQAGAVLHVQTPVTALEKTDDGWRLETPRGSVSAQAVIVATGGLALPKSGSDGRGYMLARQFGHSIIKTTPALTPLLANAPLHHQLSGLTLPVRLRLHQSRDYASSKRLALYDGSFLFTHVGYSGPVALNISRHVVRERWNSPEATVTASFLPQVDEGTENSWWHDWQGKNSKKTVSNALAGLFPERLQQAVLWRARVEPTAIVGKLTRDASSHLKSELFFAPLPVNDVAPYEKAETTAGGVALAEIEPHSMMSRLEQGLFFTGEVCDVDGWLGGYNFQWCWSSGTVAGRAAAKYCRG